MNVTIYKTCELLTEQNPLIDNAATIIKTQIVPLLIVFFVIPLIFTIILTSMIHYGMKRKHARGQVWIMYFITQLVCFISYLLLMSLDYSIFINLIHSIG